MKSARFYPTALAYSLGATLLAASMAASAVPLDVFGGPIVTDALKADQR